MWLGVLGLVAGAATAHRVAPSCPLPEPRVRAALRAARVQPLPEDGGEEDGVAPPLKPGPASAPPAPKRASGAPTATPHTAVEAPVFYGTEGLTPAGEVARRWLLDAANHGLEPGKLQGSGEAKLTRELARLAVRLRPVPRQAGILVGKRKEYLPPDVLWQGVTPPEPTPQDVRAVQEAARRGAEALEAWLWAQCPHHEQYARLVKATRHYRALCRRTGPWPRVFVPAVDQRIGRGWRDSAKVEALQRRLAGEGFFGAEPSGTFGTETREALRAYQAVRNLRTRGMLDRETARSLNVPCKRRLAVLELNLRRWRVSGLRSGEPSYLFVNLAGFEARHVQDGALVEVHRVIVGEGRSFWSARQKRRIYRNRTPILTDAISTVILNPPWKIPRRLIRDEVRPALEKDPEYLEKKGYVRRVAANGFEMIVQPPGPKNVLGDVKLSFPNTESIYIHDTDKRGLFRLARRDFSHGCVRIDQATLLARKILEADNGRGTVEHRHRGVPSIARAHRTWSYPMNRPLPVFFEYYTASVDDDGHVWFHPDIYDYDQIALVGPYGRRKPAR